LECLFERPVDLVTENNLGNPYFRQRVQSERQNLYVR
jgi:predicted nucleotidyltransferase